MLDIYINTINVFSKYDNVLGFNVGNEVIVDPGEPTGAAAFIKAAARDVRSYLCVSAFSHRRYNSFRIPTCL